MKVGSFHVKRPTETAFPTSESQAAPRDTIFAVASGLGRTAVSVIRMSGRGAGAALASLLQGDLPPPRRAALRRVVDPNSGDVLDQSLVLWLPAPSSFTGEDQAELQIHGSVAVRSAVLRVLSDLPGCRQAEPGEFARRAFLNGKLDLTAVEGLADLIDAETEAQRRQALRQLEGSLADRVAQWRERLIDAMASCEAMLDFSDEGDVPDDMAAASLSIAASVRAEVAAALSQGDRGERMREGFRVVIAGPPNAGKSTLLNAIARRDVAIVSPIPGTTRDAIEIRCDLGGLPVTFVDTAGLRESTDLVEREGVARARSHMERADLILWLHPCDVSPEGASLATLPDDGSHLVVATKSDLGSGDDTRADLAVSALSGLGVDELLARIESLAAQSMTSTGDAVLTRERHRTVLREVVSCLDRVTAIGRCAEAAATELLAEDLRLALRHLGRMTGTVDVEEVLDRIFESFCIGK